MPQVTAAQVLHRHTRWDCWASRHELPVQYSRQTRGSSIHACPELRAHYKSHHRTTPSLALLRRTVTQDDSGWQRAHDHHTYTGETSPSSFMSLPASQRPMRRLSKSYK